MLFMVENNQFAPDRPRLRLVMVGQYMNRFLAVSGACQLLCSPPGSARVDNFEFRFWRSVLTLTWVLQVFGSQFCGGVF